MSCSHQLSLLNVPMAASCGQPSVEDLGVVESLSPEVLAAVCRVFGVEDDDNDDGGYCDVCAGIDFHAVVERLKGAVEFLRELAPDELSGEADARDAQVRLLGECVDELSELAQ